LEGYMVIQEASVVHSSVELEINQLIPGWVQNWGYVLFCEIPIGCVMMEIFDSVRKLVNDGLQKLVNPWALSSGLVECLHAITSNVPWSQPTLPPGGVDITWFKKKGQNTSFIFLIFGI
jgi:hypothetical protein